MGLSLKKRINENKLLLLIIGLFAVFLIFNFSFPKLLGDDVDFIRRLNKYGYIGASIEHYNNWSSRIILESVLMFMAKNFFVWRISNALVMLGTVVLLANYGFGKIDSKSLAVSFSIYSLIPVRIMVEAGWVATTLNYHWPFFLSLLSFYPFYQILKNREINKWYYIFSVISLVFASNQEQINLCFFVLTSIITVYFIINHKYKLSLSIFSLISFLDLLLFLFSPGNKARTLAETSDRFPDFLHYNLFQKLDLGISSFGKGFYIDFNMIFVVLFLLIFLINLTKNNKNYIKIISGIPLFFNLLIFIGKNTNVGFIGLSGNQEALIFNNTRFEALFSLTGTGFNISSPKTWLATILILGLLICTLVGIYFSFNRQETSIFVVLLMLMAVSSRIIMGFSPTVWVSGMRTFMVFYFVISLIILLFLEQLKSYLKNNKYDNILNVFIILGVTSFIIQNLNFIGY